MKQIEEIKKEFNSIINIHLGEVSDDKETIMVIFEPIQFSGEMWKFLKELQSQTRKECYDEMREMIKSKIVKPRHSYKVGTERYLIVVKSNKKFESLLKQLDEKEGK